MPISCICHTGGGSEMFLMFLSCMDFVIGIVAYFRFVGTKLRSTLWRYSHPCTYLYLQACVCIQGDIYVYESDYALSLDPDIIQNKEKQISSFSTPS